MTGPWLHPSSFPPPSSLPLPSLLLLLDNLSLTTAAALLGNRSCSSDDEAFKYRAYTVTYLMVFPVALLSNGGALLVFLLHMPRRSRAAGVVMTNMALSDASFSLTLPLRLAYYFRGAVWDFPDWLCRICVFCFYVNLYTSVLFLTLLSVLRWLAVVHPLKHRNLATPRRSALACLFVWVFVGGASAPFLSHGIVERAGHPRCFEPSSPSSWRRVRILNYVGLVIGFLLPFLTIVSCYGSLVRRLTTAQPNLSDNKVSRAGNLRRHHRRQRSVHLVAMVTATFLLCFLPYHIIRSLHLEAVVGRWGCLVTVSLQRVLVVTLCLAASNSVINPLLYYYSTRTFRDSIRDSIRDTHSALMSSRGSIRRRNTT